MRPIEGPPFDRFAVSAEQVRALRGSDEAARLTFKIVGHMPGMGYNNVFLYEARGSINEAEKDAFRFLVAWIENTGGWHVSPIKRSGADLATAAKHAIQVGAAKQGVADALYMLLHE